MLSMFLFENPSFPMLFYGTFQGFSGCFFLVMVNILAMHGSFFVSAW